MNEYVSIPVPTVHYRTVMSYVASLIAGPASNAREWSADLLQRLYVDSQESTITVLIAMAERAGEWVTVAQLGTALGKSDFRSVAGALGPVTKRMKKYGEDSAPFETKQDPKTGRYSYRMGEQTAKTLLDLHHGTERVIAEIRSRKKS